METALTSYEKSQKENELTLENFAKRVQELRDANKNYFSNRTITNLRLLKYEEMMTDIWLKRINDKENIC